MMLHLTVTMIEVQKAKWFVFLIGTIFLIII